MRNETSRRSWLKAMGLGAGALLGSRWEGLALGAPTGEAKAASDGVLRVAHITDVHVQPELGGGRGMAMCLNHIQSRKDRPSLILNTGDCIMDSFRQEKARTELQWELWRKVLRDECSLPMEHCLGNHDIWGADKKASKTTGEEALWGKKMGLEHLGLGRPYHSFDHGAWHFVMLDSVVLVENSFRGRLDDEQFAWLEADLKATDPKRPVLIGSHMPILSPSSVLGSTEEDPDRPGYVRGNGGGMHLDVQRIWRLFLKHPNVKLCVSGHLHRTDRAEYRGVTYVTNPAVCGNKWKGKVADRWGEMYTMLELRPDGTFDVEYVDYGWKVEKAPKEEKQAAG
jgi:3',5'-cyclic AMP phosphodiesterase CpdA